MLKRSTVEAELLRNEGALKVIESRIHQMKEEQLQHKQEVQIC
jgi:hypothetical protein